MVTPLLCLQLATSSFLRFGDVLKLGEVQGSLIAVFFLFAKIRPKKCETNTKDFSWEKWTKFFKFGKEKNSNRQTSTISSSK
jgi:hypothetical protein